MQIYEVSVLVSDASSRAVRLNQTGALWLGSAKQVNELIELLNAARDAAFLPNEVKSKK